MAKDFDKAALTQATEQHGKDITGLDERISALEGQLKTPKQITALLEAASEDSKGMDILFSKLFCDMLAKDPNVKTAISDHIQKADRQVIYSNLKKWGGFIAAAAIYVAGLITSKVVDRFLS